MTEVQKVTWLASYSHFITHGFMTLFPAVMVIIAGENSMSFMDIGIIANVGYFLYGIGAFPAGYLADRFGSKRILTIGIIGMSISSVLISMSWGIWSFAASYSLLGLFASIHHPAGLSLIARRVKEKKGKALGLHGVMGNVGLFLTPLFAALCVWLFGSWRSSYLLFGILGFGLCALIHLNKVSGEPDLCFKDLFNRKTADEPATDAEKMEEEQQSTPETSAKKESIPAFIPVSLLLLFAGSILSGFIFRGSLTFFPTLFKEEIHFITNHDEPVVIAGFLTSGVLSFGLIGAWFGGFINDKVKKPEFIPAIVFLIVAPALFLISRYSDSKLIVAGCIFSLIYYAWQPSQNYLVAKYTRKASLGKGFGVNFFLIFGVGSMATAIGGYVADDFGVDLFYWIMSIVALAAIVTSVAVYYFRKYNLRFICRLEKESEQ